MIAEILDALIKTNLAAGAATLAVLAARRPLRRVAGARLAYSLWLTVPLAAAASLLPPRTIMTGPATALPSPPLGSGAQTAIAWVDQTGLTQNVTRIEPTVVALTVWATGVLLSLAILALIQNRSLRRLGPLRPAPGELRTMLARTAGFGPAVVGALLPRIVLPADFETRFEPKERTVILAHEKIHLDHGDAQINALVVLNQCVNWFNPIVHLAAYLVRLDQELACDAAVMARYPEARRSYAEAMLKTQLAPAPLPLGCYWPARSEHPLKERLTMLKTTPLSRQRRLAGLACVATLALGAGFSAWAAQPAKVIKQPTAAPASDATPIKPSMVGSPEDAAGMNAIDKALMEHLAATAPDIRWPVTIVAGPARRAGPMSTVVKARALADARKERTVELRGMLTRPDGSSTPFDLGYGENAISSTWRLKSGAWAALKSRNDDMNLTLAAAVLIDGKPRLGPVMKTAFGAPLTLPLDGGYALTVTASLRPPTAREQANRESTVEYAAAFLAKRP